jgi:hypothetical protein
MDDFFDDPLGLDPLSALPSRDSRWFIPAHGAGSFRTANLRERETAISEFPTWRRAQLDVAPLPGEARLRRAS